MMVYLLQIELLKCFYKNSLFLLFLLSSCNGNIQHEYPDQKEIEIISKQGKYQSIKKEFNLSNNQKDLKMNEISSLCQKIEFFAINQYGNVKNIGDNSQYCSFQSDLIINNKSSKVFINASIPKNQTFLLYADIIKSSTVKNDIKTKENQEKLSDFLNSFH